MVKNEAEVICQTLQPYIDAGMRSFIVYDTGSDDATPEIARELFKTKGISEAYVIEEAFVDFGTSRNKALEYTYQKFPEATFVLMIDAEWYIHNVDQLIHFCRNEIDTEESVYLLRIKADNTTFYTGRLMRCSACPKFIGSVHESLDVQASMRVPDSVYFDYSPSSKGLKNTFDRWTRDEALLLKDLARNPQDVRTLFYLGQTTFALEDMHKAYHYYKLCSLQGKHIPHHELIYLAHYRLGKISEMLANSDENFSWQRAMGHYLDAFSYRPHRAEPLVAIAQYYWDMHEYDLCFLFAQRAAALSYPPDYFCVEDDVFSYTRYNLLGASAGRIGEMVVGKWAVEKALNARPQLHHLQQNLAEYERLATLKKQPL